MRKFLLLLTFIMFQGLVAAPIHDAAQRGDLDEVEKILSQNLVYRYLGGNNINSINKCGITPLGCAVIGNHAEVVEMLIRQGANVNAIDENGWIPLHYSNCTVLHYDSRTPSHYGWTSLHYAVRDGHAEIVKILIRHGANVNAIDENGWTPLHFATMAKVVKILIRHGANINAINYLRSTPLATAAFRGNENIVRILLEDPFCDHTIINNDNETPEDIARSLDHIDIANILHNAPSVEQKLVKSERNDVLQLLAAGVANKNGVYEEDYNKLGTSVKHWITNVRKDKKPSYLDEAGPSGYHSDGDVSSIATEDLEAELQQQESCSI